MGEWRGDAHSVPDVGWGSDVGVQSHSVVLVKLQARRKDCSLFTWSEKLVGVHSGCEWEPDLWQTGVTRVDVRGRQSCLLQTLRNKLWLVPISTVQTLLVLQSYWLKCPPATSGLGQLPCPVRHTGPQGRAIPQVLSSGFVFPAGTKTMDSGVTWAVPLAPPLCVLSHHGQRFCP